MSDNPFCVELKNLIDQYNKEYISFKEYRAQRKLLLDQIDEKYNGVNFDRTQPKSIYRPESSI